MLLSSYRRPIRWLLIGVVALSSILMSFGEARANASEEARPVTGPLSGPDAAAGPLVVSAANPRYFTVGSGGAADRKVVYLTGSHVWNNFHDGLGPGATCGAEENPYSAYLELLRDHGHNVIRLWRWEHFSSVLTGPSGTFHLCMTPQPWARTGSGTASDGQPRFDLSRFDQAYFDRLRDRVIAAGNQGSYVSVMFFDGFCLQLCAPPTNLAGHPFYGGNNTNGIGIASVRDYQVLPLDPRIQQIQAAYLRKVVDTVHDLPNVLYEVANESPGNPDSELGDSTQWQYWVIDYVKRYEASRGYDRHPVGMTMQYPVADQSRVNEPLLNSPADWISPGFDDQYFDGRWYTDPLASDGRKVIISDTDHYAAGLGDALWAWKTFLRAHNPILMDFGIIDAANPGGDWEPAQLAMGDTRRHANLVKLIDMQPRGDLSSTGYALANPGSQYLVLQPSDSPAAFTVTLAAGMYAVRWHSLNTSETKGAGSLTVGSQQAISFTAPFAGGPAVLHVKKVAR
jgi:hypothetical protein